jgi:16S rRNA (cytosine967-C5)-methyltransferase
MNETVSPARQSAFEILRRVAVEDAYAGPLLGSARYTKLSREDHNLLHELTLGVLRRQGWLDFLIEHYAKRSITKLDLEVVIALRLGLYQLKVLTRIPAHAAINESVNLVRQAQKRSAVPFTNAILRAAQRDAESGESRLPTDPLQRLSIVTSTPLWLLRRWQQRWGLEETTALATECNLPPQAVFRYNERFSTREATDRWLSEHSIRTRPAPLVPEAAIIDEGGLGPESRPVREDWIYFQEESSQLAARLAAPVEPNAAPRAVWDVCAAPGGKSALIASLLPTGSRQIATELHTSRLQLMRELFRRQGVEEIQLVQADLTSPSPFAPESFDQIIVDAPCSGLGTIRKHPEIKWRCTPEKITAMAALQRKILETAAESLRPGGLLTYSVCSTEVEEGEEVIGWFRNRHPEYRDLTRERLIELRLDPASLLTPTHGARTFPHQHHTEGFFICVLWKRRPTEQS